MACCQPSLLGTLECMSVCACMCMCVCSCVYTFACVRARRSASPADAKKPWLICIFKIHLYYALALVAPNTRNAEGSVVAREQSRYGVDVDGIASSLFWGGGCFLCLFVFSCSIQHMRS